MGASIPSSSCSDTMINGSAVPCEIQRKSLRLFSLCLMNTKDSPGTRIMWTRESRIKMFQSLLTTTLPFVTYTSFAIPTSSETQGQSVGSGEKAELKFSSKGGRAPGYRLSPDHFQKFKRMSAPDWAQKMFCIIVPNRRTVSPEFFSWVRTRRLLSRSRLVWLMHQRIWYKIPIWFRNTVCPKTKESWRFSKNTSLSLQQVFTLASVTRLA